jgi:hypothetical protein
VAFVSHEKATMDSFTTTHGQHNWLAGSINLGSIQLTSKIVLEKRR